MKRFLSVGLLCMSLFTTIQAQTTHTVKHMETQLQDVLNVLEDMDIHIHRFDVSQFLDATYQMEIYVDEEIADDIITISKSFNIDAQIVGRCYDNDEGKGNKLTIISGLGKFIY